ncbi:MAG: glycosyltransferase family 4 protein [Chitinispirillia bacterium]|nr:glycosyltransferase family 4 protein [Chitinispirillia bacterium]MCL2269500.1 glycosyltransferase family 4 protein [Chitinispirillia bacterium]
MEAQNDENISVLVLSSVYPRRGEDSEVPWLRASLGRLREGGCSVAVVAPAHRGLKSHIIDDIAVHRYRYAPAALEMLTHDEGGPSKIAKNPFLQILAVPYVIFGSLKTLLVSIKTKPRIFHVHWPFPHAFMAYCAALFRKIPVVLNFHGAELLLAKKKKWIRPILKSFIKRADLIIANSTFTAGKVREIYDKDVVILPYGTTLGSGDANAGDGAGGETMGANAGDGRFRVLFVGRHIERKGIEYLIRAAAMLDPGKFEVRIVGHGNLTERLKEQAANEAPQQVTFTGKLSTEQLEEEYKSAGCFVLPAIVDSRGDTEGLGVVLIEAAEYGVPIVASGVGGITDVIINNRTGLLVKEKSPQELANALQSLYNDGNLSQTLAKNCREQVREFFSWDRITAKQIELYRGLLK